MVLSVKSFTQECQLKLEMAYGRSTSVIEMNALGSSYRPLAENSIKVALLSGINYQNSLSLNAGLSFVFVQLPQRSEFDSTNSPYDYYVNILNEKLYYLSIPINIGCTFDYFTLYAGSYFAFCINPESYWDGPKYYDIGLNLKLQFNIYKGLYFFQESRVGLININSITAYSKRQYALFLGLGYSFLNQN